MNPLPKSYFSLQHHIITNKTPREQNSRRENVESLLNEKGVVSAKEAFSVYFQYTNSPIRYHWKYIRDRFSGKIHVHFFNNEWYYCFRQSNEKLNEFIEKMVLKQDSVKEVNNSSQNNSTTSLSQESNYSNSNIITLHDIYDNEFISILNNLIESFKDGRLLPNSLMWELLKSSFFTPGRARHLAGIAPTRPMEELQKALNASLNYYKNN
jgi:hypothetical protein